MAITSYPISDIAWMKGKMLNWSKRFNIFCFLDNHEFRIHPGRYECVLAAGSTLEISSAAGHHLADINALTDRTWLFGHISYRYGETLFQLDPKPDPAGFADFAFFRPKFILIIKDNVLTVHADDPARVYSELQSAEEPVQKTFVSSIRSRLTREAYIDKIRQLQNHIHKGDCYEVNFCQEFYAESAEIDPVKIFEQLNQLSPNPFSALYRQGNSFLICASPERFLFREGQLVYAQPMKGTAPRVIDDPERDLQEKTKLESSQKEKAENVMVVDLVRNDLSKLAEEGTVTIEELFGIYSYPQVHQMISTVMATLRKEVSFADIVEATFPMGSMTGAPKKRVMELINQYEKEGRGIFSGSLGYIAPGGNFDFNVVIRSIMYHSVRQYLSFQAGSGITIYSDPEKEWEECLLKVAAIKKVLTVNSPGL